jgi:transcriptional regulator with XRE-family HTH domain
MVFKSVVMAVTIKTIAEKVNLSNQAVSAVLNDKTNCRVSPKNRELILQVARELGYTSSISAQVMRGKATKTVAILCSSPYIQIDEHLTRITLELMNRFNTAGYGCLYALAALDAADNMKMVREPISRGATAFVFLGEPVGRGKLESLIWKFGHTVISCGANGSMRYVESCAGRILCRCREEEKLWPNRLRRSGLPQSIILLILIGIFLLHIYYIPQILLIIHTFVVPMLFSSGKAWGAL